ncbi:RNA-directed DNA polymerase (reverse transcriptase)-related family protein [Rhynchospora pubera]|uniref:RNA-directed DNA polymerase (Reverse transcriptase)-related family protein n=1 Tax=Rhynchospora pubera TaxID=906938 RepID=A0AAV8ECU9_9POAL|nr:RNA-directed DNA polymerase (reverse transcriptase)-related family protein [Rhynchospora pubera]
MLEERRNLTHLEVRLRVLTKERAFELASVLETRWFQRSRCKWIAEGDRNTAFFHSYASARMRRKHITQLEVNGVTLTDRLAIATSFRDFYDNLLGRELPTEHLDLSPLYLSAPPLDLLTLLDLPFTIEEIRFAVFSLADNKASGPDGIFNEFAKKQWNEVQWDVAMIFQDLFLGNLQLSDSNQAHIVLVPKKELSGSVQDFRPISVINYVPKLISKVLANRLKQVLPHLISSGQTGFLAGRYIAENFNCAREFLHHIENSKQPGLMFKIDFAKAFDSVSWSFLIQVLEQRGIPCKFVSWIRLILSSASSSILLDGTPGEPFTHRRGLRQGDPISPYLFILVADVLSVMLLNAGASINNALTDRLQQPFYLFQYADDALLFSSAEEQAVQILKQTLLLFSNASGLRINLAKSNLVPLNLEDHMAQTIKDSLQCQLASLPITYLGLPLTSKKPNRTCFQPLLEKLERRLATWKSKLITRAGRLQLISSVLLSIPIYYLSCFSLPKWLIKKIDGLCRRFLWSTPTGGIPLKNWASVCLPKNLGGLGLKDLVLQNKALLLRWWWRLYTAPNSLWFQNMSSIYSRRSQPSPPITWLSSGSFFWKELFNLRLLFQLSTCWEVASGILPSFWYDAWGGEPILYLTQEDAKPTKPNCSLLQAFPLLNNLLPMPRSLRTLQFVDEVTSLNLTDGQDKVFWKWSTDGLYSSKSTYKQLVSAGKVFTPVRWIWKLKVPPKIILFGVLLLQGKLLTQQVLFKRNIQVQPGCVLCSTNLVEDDLHLFFLCPYSTSLWVQIQNLIGLKVLPGKDTVLQTVLDVYASLPSTDRNKKMCFVLTALWMLWRERNNRRFRGEEMQVQGLARNVIHEGELFFRNS